jgi:hypothetical protein
MKKVKSKLGGNGLYSSDMGLVEVSEVMNTDDFISTYLSYTGDLSALGRCELATLTVCIRNSKYYSARRDIGNVVMFDDRCIDDIIAYYRVKHRRKVTYKSVNNAMANLTKMGVIVKSDGLKFINKTYFPVGDINKSAKVAVKLTAEFMIDETENI